VYLDLEMYLVVVFLVSRMNVKIQDADIFDI